MTLSLATILATDMVGRTTLFDGFTKPMLAFARQPFRLVGSRSHVIITQASWHSDAAAITNRFGLGDMVAANKALCLDRQIKIHLASAEYLRHCNAPYVGDGVNNYGRPCVICLAPIGFMVDPQINVFGRDLVLSG